MATGSVQNAETSFEKGGHNIGRDGVFDIFTRDEKKILWASEWKSAWSGDEELSSRLSEAKDDFVKDGKPGPRVMDAKKEGYELPDYGYAFAIRITESYVEILWEKVKIPKP